MPDWPRVAAPNTVAPIFISNAELLFEQTGMQPDAASVAWTANAIVYSPIYIPRRMTVKQLYAMNGASVSGNCDIGLLPATWLTVRGGKGLMYAQPTFLAHSGSTAQAGTSQWQAFNVTDVIVGRGLYFLAYNLDNGTGTVTTLRNISVAGDEIPFITGCGYAKSGGAVPIVPVAPTAITGMTFGLNAVIPLLALGGVA